MIYPLVRELAEDGIPVTVTCRVLKIARQPYYRWLADPVTESEWSEAHLADALFDAHRDDPEFGYRFLADEVRDNGQQLADRTAWRICSDNGWWSVFGKKKRGKKTKVGTPAHDDLVLRDFTAPGPNELWLTDLTEHPTREGKLYLCAIKDEWSNRIVGYSMSDRMQSQIAVTALHSAVARRGGNVAGCILHSDRGSQGGFNWPSQHLDREVEAWLAVLVRSKHGLGRIEGRSRRRGRRRWPGARIGSGSGPLSPAAPGLRTHAAQRACRGRSGSAGFATLAA